MNALYRNGLKGQQALSPGQRPGYDEAGRLALKGQKLCTRPIGESGKMGCFCPFRAHSYITPLTQGVALG